MLLMVSVLISLKVASCLLSVDQNLVLTPSAKRAIRLQMVRNIDLAEAIIFYGKESLVQESDGTYELLEGVEYLIAECQRDDTAVLAILPAASKIEVPKAMHVCQETQQPPNPRDLREAIHFIDIQPKGFGGSSGFGRKAADPGRPPLPKHCVVFCHTEDQCRAARYAGMRVLCLTDNLLADAVIDYSWESICMDDIATPGSFWLNPPYSKDDDGNAVDPEAVINAYENANSDSLDGPQSDNGELTDDQLGAMLADIDPL
jgi:hypothetical protein